MADDLPIPSESPSPTEPRRGAARLAVTTVGPATPPPPDVDWRRCLRALNRYKWLVLLVTVLGTGLGVWATRLVEPVLPAYRARATLWIDATAPSAKQPVPQGPQGPIGSGQLLGSSGWVGLLKSELASFSLKEGVRPGHYRLAVDSTGRTFELSAHGDVLRQRGVVGDSVGAAVGFAWVPPVAELQPRRTIEFSVNSPDEAADVLAKDLDIHADLDGNFLTIDLRGADPGLITAIVNAIAERCVAVAADLKRQKLLELTKILNDQLEHAEVGLRNTEAELRGFRIRAVFLLSQGVAPVTANLQHAPDPVFANFFQMRVDRDELRRDRAAIERALSQMPDSGLQLDALELIPAVQRSTEVTRALLDLTSKKAELRALQYHYTNRTPSVQHLAGEISVLERRTIPLLLRSLIASLTAREADLAQRVDSASGDLRQIPPVAIAEARLQRDVTSAEQLFTNIQQRYEEARLAAVSSLPDLRILDRAAVPHLPVVNFVPFLILMSFVGSLGVGILSAVVLDRVDRRLHYPQQVTDAMGLTILGAVPRVHRSRGRADDGAGQAIEALRGIRLNLQHAHGTAGPVLVTITSPGRADGKSFIASNLALAFADGGHRTLLIDGDVRRGSLHRVLNASRKPGLTDALAGTVPAEQVVQRTPFAGLWFIGCGTRMHTGAELLSSTAMACFLGGLRTTYSVILVDSAPLAAGVDAYALGTLTGSVLMVLRTGVSDRELAEAKLEVLSRLPVRVLGAVLNDLRPNGAYRYYSYYLQGYDLQDEVHGARRPVLSSPD